MTTTDTMLPTLATALVLADGNTDDEQGAGTLLYQHLECHGWSVGEVAECDFPDLSEMGSWEQVTKAPADVRGLRVVESWDRDMERPDLLSDDQLDTLCAYLEVAHQGSLEDTCEALLAVLEKRKGRAVEEARAALRATIRAGRTWDGIEDGIDTYLLGAIGAVTEPEANEADRARHRGGAVECDVATYLADAFSKAENDGIGDARRQMAEVRVERYERLASFITEHASAFFTLACANRWREAQTHANALKRCGDGIRTRYAQGVEWCKGRGDWTGLYLTRAQRDELVRMISAAFAAVKNRPTAIPRDLI